MFSNESLFIIDVDRILFDTIRGLYPYIYWINRLEEKVTP